MRVMEIKLFNVEELSEGARNEAYKHWLNSTEYGYCDANRRTLEVFEDIFPIRVLEWSYGGCGDYINFEFTDDYEIEEMKGLRLLKYLYNHYFDYIYKDKLYSLFSKKEKVNRNYGKVKIRRSNILKDNCCVLTGYYLDNVILEPIYNFLKNPNFNITFQELIDCCLDNWLKACTEDFEESQSMTYFIEEMINNDVEFLEDGRIFK